MDCVVSGFLSKSWSVVVACEWLGFRRGELNVDRFRRGELNVDRFRRGELNVDRFRRGELNVEIRGESLSTTDLNQQTLIGVDL
ncbi:jg11308 [Pararge aegeria aegeria]|uniref:Jg11308 protein n=1 Tax=Pararge aegeria aegeria TaxID=348720 RepID=A0A8S4QLV8_9NEOP|nr:jg11308 [Pararge aegeria aegeria]